MRVGVDATCWTNRRGYGRFARALLTATLALDRANEYVFFVDDESPEFPLPAGVTAVRVAASVPTVKAAAANGRRSLKDMWVVSRAISREALDLVFFPSVYSYLPLTTSAPQLVTIHDVIPELFPELVFPSLSSKLFWGAKVRYARARARLILTVSEYSRDQLAEKLKISPDRIRVVPEAGDPAFRTLAEVDRSRVTARLKLPAHARLLAYVGGFSPHKNLPMLVDIFAGMSRDEHFSGLYLLLVGDFEGDVFFSCYPQLVTQVREAGVQDRVIFTGYMGDADLLNVLNVAEALVLPSFSEGFGLPAVEAAACGTPSVVTTESPLPELLGKGAIGVAPKDRAGWENALRAVLSDRDRRDAMGVAAREAASRLSWLNSARHLLAIFEEVFQSRVGAD
jgi:glycosyltransferase involved in cell wall biosynthesis